MRRYFILLAIVFQLAVLGYMAGKREMILANGRKIYLRTAPIDPRDPFRGDFVRLTYPFNTVYSQQMQGTVKDHLNDKGYQVYAVLKTDEGDLYTLDYLTDRQPQNRIYLKGRITRQSWGRGSGTVNVKYGLEQLFVEQGKGHDIERIRGARSGMQVPMEVQVGIGGDGTAVLRDFRWSKLGIQLEMLRLIQVDRRSRENSEQHQSQQILSPKVKVTLKNVSDTVQVIADPGDHCGFKLVPVRWVAMTYTPVDTTCNQTPLTEQSFVTLEPGQTYKVELDLHKPRWHMQYKNSKGKIKTGEIGRDNYTDMFRIIYQSPGSDRLQQWPDTASIWRGHLPSRAFNARGRID